jgi:hypothetical protein
LVMLSAIPNGRQEIDAKILECPIRLKPGLLGNLKRTQWWRHWLVSASGGRRIKKSIMSRTAWLARKIRKWQIKKVSWSIHGWHHCSCHQTLPSWNLDGWVWTMVSFFGFWRDRVVPLWRKVWWRQLT